jgi:hypothetical protein
MSFILKFSKVKSFNELRGLGRHDERTSVGAMPHVDVDKTELNRYLPGTEGVDYVKLWHNREYECNKNGGQIKLRKNSVYAINAYLSFSHDSENKGGFDVYKWYEDSVKWLQDEFGKENVIAACLHMDEATPHIHAVITPVDERGKLNIKAFLSSKGSIRQHRKSYAAVMKGYGLTDGVRYRKSDHQAIKKFYRNVNLCENTKVPERKEGEAVWDWEKRVNGFVSGVMYKWLQDREKAKKRIGELEARYKQQYVKYRAATELYDMLLEKFDGDEKLAKKELEYFKTMEEELPMENCEKLLSEIYARLKHNPRNLLTMETKPVPVPKPEDGRTGKETEADGERD